MTVFVYAAIVFSVLVFVTAVTARAVQYARSPIHLRWELYPVPHERPDRVAHGGSYFEQSEWWREPRRSNLRGELAVMVPEMLFLNALREFNRGLWLRSFPFHFGLYLIAAAGAGLLALAAATFAAGTGWPGGSLARACEAAVAAVGSAGLVLAVAGALALLHRRLSDVALRTYSSAGDVFNLAFFVVALSTLGIGYATRPDGFPGALGILTGLLTWDAGVPIPPLLAAGLIMSSALLAYIPLTHMSHFVAKYFTYHAVRWDDAPVGDDRRVRATLAAYLTHRPTWAAGHIRGSGAPTWADIVATNPSREDQR
jgi:nitrate reductase gamma subunit